MLLLAAVAAAVVAARRTSLVLPAAGLLMGVLAAGGASLLRVPAPQLSSSVALHLLVPVVVMEGALSMPPVPLRRDRWAIGLLALPGTVVFAALLAWLAWLLGVVPGPLAPALAVAVAATDPIAILALRGRLPLPARVVAVLEGESVFNDAVAIALFVALGAGGALAAPGDALFELARLSLYGVLLGWGAGRLLARVLRGWDPSLSTWVVLALALALPLLAEQLYASTVVAVVVAGLTLGRRLPLDRRFLDSWAWLGTAAAATAFVLTGTSLDLTEALDQGRAVLALAAAATLARAVVTLGVALACRLPLRQVPLMTWGGLRGGLSVGLALTLAAAGHPAEAGLALGYIALTIAVQAPTLGALARLGGAGGPAGPMLD
ncbi:MAG: cation:proton antiporter domain-containing protein [Candidatus Dormibacteria bacterium]